MSTTEPTAVLIDDHDLFRDGLRDVLEDSGVRVVGEAGDGERGVELVAELAPDVAVMDLNMPGIGGVEAIRRIAAPTPRTGGLGLAISGDEESIRQALAAGAMSCLMKDAPVEELLAGVRAAAGGA